VEVMYVDGVVGAGFDVEQGFCAAAGD
jgi:hypothetical protein